ncbi:hypothetical protein DSO57_1001199 [Entomophthora muscae]|uniref:Uncharacterized protein n=1 Tax=Entomophthora muscae TaxID=34485 RepID=A0ACC2TX97_9FUNG|nr:hypothetical protein DSO57_1001199 [Entomophthora muscae]
MLKSVLNDQPNTGLSSESPLSSEIPTITHVRHNPFEDKTYKLVQPIDKKAILNSKSFSANSHTAYITNIIGAHIVLIEEVNSENYLKKSNIKILTGEDALVMRHPHEKREFVVDHPCHTIIVTCNSLPYMSSDYFLGQQFKIINFNITFVSKVSLDAEERAVMKSGSVNCQAAFYGLKQTAYTQDPGYIHKLVQKPEF